MCVGMHVCLCWCVYQTKMSPELQRACRQMPKTFSLVACSLLMFFKYCMHFHGLNYILSFSNQRVSLACHLHGVLPGQGYAGRVIVVG
jgi:hypothetical protein